MLNDLKISAVVIMRKTLVNKKMLFAGSMHVLGHVELPFGIPGCLYMQMGGKDHVHFTLLN